MSLTFMTSHAMVAVTHDMLTDPVKLKVLESDALTRELRERIREMHGEMAALTKADGRVQARLQEISEELRVCDQVHDRLTRGMYRSLEAAADLQTTAEQARPFTDALNQLFPAGLSINMLPYLEQSGNVLKVSQQFTAPLRALFESIQIQGRTLADAFDEWVQNGERMGKLVAERARLSGEGDDTRVSAGDLRELRNRWARVMNILISTLDLIGTPEADRRRLLSNLREAEAAASRTRAAEQHRKAQDESGEGADVEAAATDTTSEQAGRVEEEAQGIGVSPVAEDV